MSDRSGVFLLQGDESLVAMQPREFASEDDFQKLLSRFPELLVGDQIDPEDPRRENSLGLEPHLRAKSTLRNLAGTQ